MHSPRWPRDTTGLHGGSSWLFSEGGQAPAAERQENVRGQNARSGPDRETDLALVGHGAVDLTLPVVGGRGQKIAWTAVSGSGEPLRPPTRSAHGVSSSPSARLTSARAALYQLYPSMSFAHSAVMLPGRCCRIHSRAPATRAG